ncbi:recombinase family protein [Chloroflexota bacterium]
MNLFGITRSSNQDVAEGYGPVIQEAEFVVYADTHSDKLVCTKHIVEKATVALEDRELFREVIDEAVRLNRAGQCDGIVFSRLDRISRTMDDAIQIALDLRKAGLSIVLIRENQVLRPGDPPLSLVIFILQAFGVDTQTRVFLKNTKEGQRKAAEAGKLPSGVGGRGLYGYNLIGAQGQKKFEPNGDIWIVDEILRLGIEGESINSITRGLIGKDVHIIRDTVRKILKHARVYAGLYKWGGLEIMDLVPPRITIEQAQIIEANMERNREHSYGWGKRKWLTGHVYCGKCGGKYSLETGKKRCHCRRSNRLEYITACSAPKIAYNKLQSVIWDLIMANLCEPTVMKPQLREARQNWQAEQAKLGQQINDTKMQLRLITDKRTKLLWQHREGFISDEELRKNHKVMQSNIDFLNEKIHQLETVANQSALPDLDRIDKFWGRWMNQFLNANYFADEKRKTDIAEAFNLHVTIFPAENEKLSLQIATNIYFPLEQIELDKDDKSKSMVCPLPRKR